MTLLRKLSQSLIWAWKQFIGIVALVIIVALMLFDLAFGWIWRGWK